MTLCLTPDDLRDLTGYKRASSQIAWLTERAWVFEIDARGRPKVLRAYADSKMGASVRPTEPKPWEPDFSDLRQAG